MMTPGDERTASEAYKILEGLHAQYVATVEQTKLEPSCLAITAAALRVLERDIASRRDSATAGALSFEALADGPRPRWTVFGIPLAVLS